MRHFTSIISILYIANLFGAIQATKNYVDSSVAQAQSQIIKVIPNQISNTVTKAYVEELGFAVGDLTDEITNVVTHAYVKSLGFYTDVSGDTQGNYVPLFYSKDGTYSSVNIGTGNNTLGLPGKGSIANGNGNESGGTYSHAEGSACVSQGMFSHAEGGESTASGIGAHSEGRGTVASGNYSHAEGSDTRAKGDYSHAEGISCESRGEYSYAAGDFSITMPQASYSRALGRDAIALHPYAYTWSGKQESNYYRSHGEGTYNVNPIGGTAGFYIGEKTLYDTFAPVMATNITTGKLFYRIEPYVEDYVVKWRIVQ